MATDGAHGKSLVTRVWFKGRNSFVQEVVVRGLEFLFRTAGSREVFVGMGKHFLVMFNLEQALNKRIFRRDK